MKTIGELEQSIENYNLQLSSYSEINQKNEIQNSLFLTLEELAIALQGKIDKSDYNDDKKDLINYQIDIDHQALEIGNTINLTPFSLAYIYRRLSFAHKKLFDLCEDKKNAFTIIDTAFKYIEQAREIDPTHGQSRREEIHKIYLNSLLQKIKEQTDPLEKIIYLKKLLDFQKSTDKKAGITAHRISDQYMTLVNATDFENPNFINYIELAYTYQVEACRYDPIHQSQKSFLEASFIKKLKAFIKSDVGDTLLTIKTQLLQLKMEQQQGTSKEEEAHICHSLVSLYLKAKTKLKLNDDRRLQYLNEAIFYADCLNELDPSSHFKTIAMAYQAYALHYKITQPFVALAYYSKSLDISLQYHSDDYTTLSHCHDGLGKIYLTLSQQNNTVDNLQKARLHYTKALEYKCKKAPLQPPENIVHMLATIDHKLGLYFEKSFKESQQLFELKKAEDYYIEALELAKLNNQNDQTDLINEDIIRLRKLGAVKNQLNSFYHYHDRRLNMPNMFTLDDEVSTSLSTFISHNKMLENADNHANPRYERKKRKNPDYSYEDAYKSPKMSRLV